jgi:carboxypeptidase C (cathepsin A)
MGNRNGWRGWAAAGLMVACLATAGPAQVGPAQEKAAAKKDDSKKEEKVVVSGTEEAATPAVEADSTTEGTVTVGGQAIAYKAVAGTLTVGATDEQDATLDFEGKLLPDAGVNPPDKDKPEDAPATARIFYVAYFKKSAAAEQRPVTFLYNGGPGSATMWLHMGSFGPRRVATPDTEHQTGAPYQIVNNDSSLLDVSDLVFIDAPGTGFSRIFGKDKEKAFWGVDEDAHAFERFIRRFLTKYDRWNSPKYLFGESYGTPRSAVLSAILQDVDLNGIVLLSQILSFDNSVDGPKLNPGVDQSYALALPTYAATAYYHKKLAVQPAALEPFLAEVEQYALGDYMGALLAGSELPAERRQAVAEKLHDYTGLPVALLLKADLRITGGMFSEGPAAGRGHDDRAAGHAVQGAGPRSAERRGGVRPAEQRDLGGVYGGDQQLSAQGLEVRGAADVQAGGVWRSGLYLGLPAPGAEWRSGSRPAGGGDERDAGPGVCDEVEPEDEGDARGRVLRPGDAVL